MTSIITNGLLARPFRPAPRPSRCTLETLSHHMAPADFLTHWQGADGAKRVNYGLFLHDFAALLGVASPDGVTDDLAHDAYVLEKPVAFNDGAGKKSTDRIVLYKRGCFVLEPKQGTTPTEQPVAECAKVEKSIH